MVGVDVEHDLIYLVSSLTSDVTGKAVARCSEEMKQQLLLYIRSEDLG